MPDGGAVATAEAVRRWSAPTATARAADDDGELIVYGTDHDVY
jgi:hypothetical protein